MMFAFAQTTYSGHFGAFGGISLSYERGLDDGGVNLLKTSPLRFCVVHAAFLESHTIYVQF
jgi:hypothetical protein